MRIPYARLLGAGTVLFGCMATLYILYELLLPISVRELDFELSIVLAVAIPVLTSPCIVLAITGFRLLKCPFPENARQVIGTWCVVFAFVIFVLMGTYPPFPLHRNLDFSVQLLFATLVAVSLYVSLMGLFLRLEGFPPLPVGGLVGRGVVLLVSVELWLVAFSVFHVMSVTRIEAGDLPWWFPFADILVPIVFARLFYVTALRLLCLPRIPRSARHRRRFRVGG